MAKWEAFQNQPLDGTLEQVPGLGKVGIENLNKNGIHTSYQLLGHFLILNRDEQKMFEFLSNPPDKGGMGNRAQDVSRTAEALQKRVAEKGFQCNIRLSPHVVQTATRFTDAKKTAFMARKLTGKLDEDFDGIGPTSLPKFAAAGITRSDHLFGHFLKIIDDPDPSKNTAKCDEFYDKLNGLGAAPGLKSIIIYQLQSKLKVGIDSFGLGATAMPTLGEVDESVIDEIAYDRRNDAMRATDEKTRTGPSRVPGGASQAVRQPQFAPAVPEAAPKAAPKTATKSDEEPSSSLVKYALVAAAVAVIAYFMLLPSSAAAPALPRPAEGEWV